MTRIGIVGAGRIGGNLARLYAAAGHDVTVSFARDQDKLEALAAQIGATVSDPVGAVKQAEVVVISVPWALVDGAIEQAGGPGALAGKLVIDTTNQFGRTAAASGYSTSEIPPLPPSIPPRRRKRSGSRRSTR